MPDLPFITGGVLFFVGAALFAYNARRRSPAKPAFMDLEESADHASAIAETAYSSLLRERMIANLTAQLAKATKNKQAVRPLRARLAALQGRS